MRLYKIGHKLGSLHRIKTRGNIRGKEKAGKMFRKMMKEEKQYIAIIHCRFHWSFTTIDNIRRKLSTYDSGMQISGSHKKPNGILKTSLESTTDDKWQIEQMQVPQQDEGESCGYKMLSCLSKVVKGQVIQQGRAEDQNRLCYYLEIAQTLKDNQIKRKQKGKRKAGGGEEEERQKGETQQQRHQKKSKQEKEREGEGKQIKGRLEIASQEEKSETNKENRKRKTTTFEIG